MGDEEIRFIDLFSGVGGFRLGLERTNQIRKHPELRIGDKKRQSPQHTQSRGSGEGSSSISYRCVWSCDNNKYANQVYTKQFGEEGHHSGDIRGVNPGDIPDFDLLCAGFPCQAFSVAGKRKGFQDTRGTLFFEIHRIAEAKRPSLLLLENVKGLLNHDGGRTFTVILQSLDELGYWVEWQVLNSKHFGVPQNRERVFIVGHLRGTGGREIFPITESDGIPNEGKRERTTKDQLSTAITQNLKRGVHSGGETLIKVGNIAESGHDSLWGRVYDPDGIAMNLNAEGGGVGAKTGLYVIPVLTPDRREKSQHGRRFKEDGEPAFTLTGQDRHGVMVPSIANTVDQDGYLRFGQRVEGEVLPIAFRRIRRLTPVECERLQGFPDGWTEQGIQKPDTVIHDEGTDDEWTETVTETKIVKISDTQRYKCLGNAVTVNVITFLGHRIMEALNES